MPAPFGDGLYTIEPPSGNGLHITDLFHIVERKQDDPDINSAVDSKYPNVAIITFDRQNQFGGMWAKEKLDLTRPFATEIYLYLSRKYGPNTEIADGMTFTMHNDPAGINAIGGAGEGLGVFHGRKFSGKFTPQGNPITVEHGKPLKNALVVEFDTYRNRISEQAFVDDPPGTAHCSLVIPKDPPIQITDHIYTQNFNPIQDWVLFTARWTPNGSGGGTLDYNFDGKSHSYSVLNVLSTFGDTKVYWGFTGSTGQYTSVQAAAIERLPEQGLKIEKTVKNASGVDINHGNALPGDILTYTIRVTALPLTNPIGSIHIDDKISLLTELVSTDVMVVTNSGETFTVPSVYADDILIVNTNQYLSKENDWVELRYNVRIKPNTAGIIYNSAIVSAENLPENKESNTTDVSIFSEPKKWVSENSKAGKNDAPVYIGDNIIYEIQYANDGVTPAAITITDELDDGLTFMQASDGGNYDIVNHAVTWVLNDTKPNTVGTVQLTVIVNENAITKIVNQANVKVNDNEQPTNILENPVAPKKPVKKVANNSASGKGGLPVKKGDIITYEISYMNYTENAAEIIITDKLPIGIDYHDSNPKADYDAASRTVKWILPNIQSKVSDVVTLQVIVNSYAAFKIINYAEVKVGNTELQNSNLVINPIIGENCLNYKFKIKCRKSIKGKKIWQDNNNANGKRPLTVDIVLLRDGEPYKYATINTEKNETYFFSCLRIYKKPGVKYTYTVDEVKVPEGYTKMINGYNIINTLI